MLFQSVYLLLPDSGFDTELLKQVKELETRGVSAAEAGDLQSALQLFSQAVQILPQRASAYNNRAQALRLLGDAAGTFNTFGNIPSLRFSIVLACQAAESEASMTQCGTGLSAAQYHGYLIRSMLVFYFFFFLLFLMMSVPTDKALQQIKNR